MATVQPGERIITLDVVRGVAVMGILAMNIIGFAMPFAALVNPTAYGMESQADLVSWALSFIFVEGKMRGFFSFLFGASMLLVIERAVAAGGSGASVHYRRMAWLLVFGLIHFYFIWIGDILSGYALIGMIAYLFWQLGPKVQVWMGVALVTLQFLLFLSLAGFTYAAQLASLDPQAPAELTQAWSQLQGEFGASPGAMQQETARILGPWSGIVSYRLTNELFDPFIAVFMFGWETLAYMLFGMAALKTGFLAGTLPAARYWRWVVIGFGVPVPLYALLAWIIYRSDFALPTIMLAGMAATVPLRPLMIVAAAALVILLARRGGAITARIAAAGRAAFTNYLGTSILMTFIFYGWGLGYFGQFSRVELWWFVIGAWAIMLLWSKPWLDRFTYGPLEWLWRSLARGRMERLSRRPAAGEALT